MKLTWLKHLLVLLIIIRILATFAFIWYLADVDARPIRQSICCATPADFGVAYEEVWFTAVDGATLSGWFIPSQNGATVIVLHGYGAHRAGYTLQHVEVLATHGYGILTYDLRGHGQSSGQVRSRGWQDPVDVEAAIAYLQNRGDVDMTRLGIFGFSVGGLIALATAAQNPTLKAIMADGPGFTNLADLPDESGWQLVDDWVAMKALEWRTGVKPLPAIVDSIGQISPRFIFLIQSGDEAPIGDHYFLHASEPKELWTIPEAAHTTKFDVRPEEYATKMLAFFDKALAAEN
jgi:alpha-beta hydrolase superfamily lysophospholipase